LTVEDSRSFYDLFICSAKTHLDVKMPPHLGHLAPASEVAELCRRTYLTILKFAEHALF
jgi:hypothetical protein